MDGIITTTDYDTTVISEADLPIDSEPIIINDLDLTRWLTPDVEYGHLQLKRISWAVGDLGLNCREGDENFRIGGRFYDAIYLWWEHGFIELTSSTDIYGNEISGMDGGCDFWTAVFMSKHPDNKHFKLVKGYLKIVSVPQTWEDLIPW